MSPKTPTPRPMPVSPDNSEAEQQRLEAERAAIAESKMSGRRSTIVAGMKIAAAGQQERGQLALKRRSAAAQELGA